MACGRANNVALHSPVDDLGVLVFVTNGSRQPRHSANRAASGLITTAALASSVRGSSLSWHSFHPDSCWPPALAACSRFDGFHTCFGSGFEASCHRRRRPAMFPALRGSSGRHFQGGSRTGGLSAQILTSCKLTLTPFFGLGIRIDH